MACSGDLSHLSALSSMSRAAQSIMTLEDMVSADLKKVLPPSPTSDLMTVAALISGKHRYTQFNHDDPIWAAISNLCIRVLEYVHLFLLPTITITVETEDGNKGSDIAIASLAVATDLATQVSLDCDLAGPLIREYVAINKW